VDLILDQNASPPNPSFSTSTRRNFQAALDRIDPQDPTNTVAALQFVDGSPVF